MAVILLTNNNCAKHYSGITCYGYIPHTLSLMLYFKFNFKHIASILIYLWLFIVYSDGTYCGNNLDIVITL